MTASPASPNSPGQLKRLEQKIGLHAETLLIRHVPDLKFAKTKFAGSYDRASFKRSHTARTPEDRDAANSVLAAWDAGMNDLNEVLRNAYGLRHGYRRIGPQMPKVYGEPALGLSRVADLTSVNADRNLLTHAYPFAVSDDLFDAVELFEAILKDTLSEVKAFTLTYGVDIAAIP